MLDFLKVYKRDSNRNTVEIYPEFEVKPSKDLMIKGSHFYAIWDEEINLWSTNEFRAFELIDQELAKYAEEHKDELNDKYVKVLYLKNSSNRMIDQWIKYTTKQFPDNWKPLDDRLIFANEDVKRSDYASKKLNYPLEQMDTPYYDELTSVLYSPEELHKIEWAIGSIVNGDAKKIQKFEVLYGSAGTGKGTILEIVRRLFDGYYCTFEAKALGSASAAFALEPFKNNPLVAIQFDGDLSKIEDNTRINSLVSHEEMIVNEKFKSTYTSRFKCFIFMGTNRPVKITDAKSGLIRRLIDVSPTGNKIPVGQYNKAMEAINFELPGIAWHCKEVYESDPNYYQNYIPVNMLGASNDFYNFVEDSYDLFKSEDSITLKAAWERYKNYCDDAKVTYPYNKTRFKEELKNYFREFEERARTADGVPVRSLYSGFKFGLGGENVKKELKKLSKTGEWLNLQSTESILDIYCKDYPAQYATSEGIPSKKWVNCSTKLSDLRTTKLHYVKVPENLIVIDFDIPDKDGGKSLEKNLEAASKWPATYAEYSKSGAGIHLHYIYKGDPSKLASIYDDHIEVKVFTGNSSLRRMLTYCNDLPIAEIASGLPLKGDTKVTNFEGIKDDKALRNCIKSRMLKSKDLSNKERLSTTQTVSLIKQDLDDAYKSGIDYDLADMRPAVLTFAAGSRNHPQECIKLVGQMRFKSKEILDDEVELYEKEQTVPEDPTKIIFDCEVYPNFFCINWMRIDEELVKWCVEQLKERPNDIRKIVKELLLRNKEKVVRMINPKPEEVEDFLHRVLIGYNNKRYDNHMLWARMMGYSLEQLFNLSQKIVVKGDKDAFFAQAKEASYTDIFDYCSKKQSLKKWEIDLDTPHMEMDIPWDKPVPEELWLKIAEYCDNDVLTTFVVWCVTQADFVAREILADLAGGTVNDSTNTLTQRLIFGKNRKPQSEFNYRFLGDKPKGPCFTYEDVFEYASGKTDKKPEGMVWFPGYSYVDGVSSYRGVEEVGEGGRVYANPGSYGYSKTFDVASMHPHSVIAERLFGDYTDIFEDLVNVRVAIKHKDFEEAGKLFNGMLAKYLDDISMAKNLSNALKIAINSVYGLTAAKFENPFRDPRNVDNIVAKRGALFMIDLQLAVESLGYKVIHIKTDSIKIHKPDEFIENFVMRFGECYGYTFEVEDVWDRICLVNDAVYIGYTKDGEWKATGAEFQQPYVYKTLFTHEDIVFEDLCETKSVTKGALYLDFEDGTDLKFVGRVGRFCPMKNGGTLYRICDDRRSAVSGTKGYKWLESTVVKELGKEDDIDMSYYEHMAHDAMGSIIAFGNFDAFVDVTKPYIYEIPDSGEVEFMNPPVESAPLELPFK